MPDDARPFYLASRPERRDETLEVRNKFANEPLGVVCLASRDDVDAAISRSVEAQREFAKWPAFRRREVLLHVAQRLGDRYDEFADTLTLEVGKAVKFSRGEVDRAIDTFTLAAEESTRIAGEHLPLDVSPRGDGFEGVVKRFPVGPCSFITPFNFPLNLAAHKVAPAIAAGCVWALKPDHRTPLSSIMLGEILAETDLPAGVFSVLPCLDEARDLFSEDGRFKLLSFTGSPKVGWMLKGKAGRKRVLLELGGNAACIVDAGADLQRAADRITHGAFYQSGQSCISVQRVLAHRSLYDDLKSALIERVKSLRGGDPLDDQTFLGPLIDQDAAERVEEWVEEAKQRGAAVLTGGKRDGLSFQPTWLEGVPHDARASCQEIFGPVGTLEPFDDFDEALRIANDSEYGLQAGVFTPNLHHAWRAFNVLEVGGVVVNDIPSSRVDAMPYGGAKASGHGREGVRYSIEDMTERRLLLMKDVG